jgi:protein tyrosine phosphatase
MTTWETIVTAWRDQSPEDNQTVQQVFELTHAGQSGWPTCTIVHYQYLGWPDMDVPSNPRGVLQLVHEADAAVDQANEEAGPTSALLHCSAGIGCTGAVIVLDAILDGIHCELQKHFTSAVSSTSEASSKCLSNSDLVVQGQCKAWQVHFIHFHVSIYKFYQFYYCIISCASLHDLVL